MYTSFRRYQLTDPSTIKEVTRRVQEGFVAIISQTPGFIAYYAIDAGSGVVATISVFTDQAGADESNQRAADWVRESVAGYISGPAQVTAGRVVVHKTK